MIILTEEAPPNLTESDSSSDVKRRPADLGRVRALRSSATAAGHVKKKEKGLHTYNRHKWLDKWDDTYHWARKDIEKNTIWCNYCNRYPALRGQDNLSRGIQRLDKIQVSQLRKHQNNGKHQRCESQYRQDHGGQAGPLLPFVSIENKINVHTICLEDMAISKLQALASL